MSERETRHLLRKCTTKQAFTHSEEKRARVRESLRSRPSGFPFCDRRPSDSADQETPLPGSVKFIRIEPNQTRDTFRFLSFFLLFWDGVGARGQTCTTVGG